MEEWVIGAAVAVGGYAINCGIRLMSRQYTRDDTTVGNKENKENTADLPRAATVSNINCLQDSKPKRCLL